MWQISVKFDEGLGFIQPKTLPPPHRCVNDDTVTFLNTTMGANGEASTIRYSFDMFRFVVEPHDLYLHCTVRLCSLDDDEPCIPVSSLAFGAAG